jgi:hypothetical protein
MTATYQPRPQQPTKRQIPPSPLRINNAVLLLICLIEAFGNNRILLLDRRWISENKFRTTFEFNGINAALEDLYQWGYIDILSVDRDGFPRVSVLSMDVDRLQDGKAAL